MSSWHRSQSIGAPASEASALFEVQSTTKGAIPCPRMTSAQRNAIPNPTNGLSIYNITTNKYQYYDDVDISWKDFGTGGVGWQERIGTGNGSTTSFPLALVPSSGESILVYAGGTLSEMTTDWSYNSGTNSIVFLTAPPAAFEIYVFYMTEGQAIVIPMPEGTMFVEYRVLTNPEIVAKAVTLTDTPNTPANVLLDWVGQSAQVYGYDFTVSTNTLSWNGLALDGVISSGETLRIVYFN